MIITPKILIDYSNDEYPDDSSDDEYSDESSVSARYVLFRFEGESNILHIGLGKEVKSSHSSLLKASLGEKPLFNNL